MIEFSNGRSRLVDPAMLLMVYFLGNLILLLRIGNDLLAFEPQFLRFIVISRRQFVVGRCAAEAALLCAIGAVGVFPIFEIETYLVKPLF